MARHNNFRIKQAGDYFMEFSRFDNNSDKHGTVFKIPSIEYVCG